MAGALMRTLHCLVLDQCSSSFSTICAHHKLQKKHWHVCTNPNHLIFAYWCINRSTSCANPPQILSCTVECHKEKIPTSKIKPPTQSESKTHRIHWYSAGLFPIKEKPILCKFWCMHVLISVFSRMVTEFSAWWIDGQRDNQMRDCNTYPSECEQWW